MNTDILLMQAECPDQEADGLGLEAAISPTARENIAALWMLSVGGESNEVCPEESKEDALKEP